MSKDTIKLYVKISLISLAAWFIISIGSVIVQMKFDLKDKIFDNIRIYVLFIPVIGILFGWIPALFIADKKKHENDKKNQP